MLPGRASEAFLRGIDVLRLSKPGIPDFIELSERLMAATGWRVVAVPGLVPDAVFFDHLANRTFVAGNFIRRADQLDYLEEPDVFHDVFGHVPMLADPVFADYMAAYGRGGQRAGSLGALKRLARLYWYTVEFGLVEEAGALRIYGRGHRVEPGRKHLRARMIRRRTASASTSTRVMRTEYRIDDYQQSYFRDPEHSTNCLRVDSRDRFRAALCGARRAAGVTTVADIVEGDRVLTRGTQAYAHWPGA